MILTECKITLPAYKLAYAFCFVVILSLIRGINFSHEIVIAMEAFPVFSGNGGNTVVLGHPVKSSGLPV